MILACKFRCCCGSFGSECTDSQEEEEGLLTIRVLDYHILFNDLYLLVTSANTIHLEMTTHVFQLKHSQIYYLNRVV